MRKALYFLGENKILVFKVFFWLVTVRVALCIMPFSKVRDWTIQKSKHRNKKRKYSLPQIVRVVTVVSRFIPKASCLTQALVAYTLLSQEDYSVCLQMGVGKNQNGKFVAHAWIESQGKIVIGGNVQVKYIPLYKLEE